MCVYKTFHVMFSFEFHVEFENTANTSLIGLIRKVNIVFLGGTFLAVDVVISLAWPLPPLGGAAFSSLRVADAAFSSTFWVVLLSPLPLGRARRSFFFRIAMKFHTSK